MTNQQLWESYKEVTDLLSENCRKLAFAAGGIGWVLRAESDPLQEHVKLAFGFLVVFFIADILQYFVGAILLRCWTRAEEKRKWKEAQEIESEYDKPSWIDTPPFVLWILKVFSLLGAYIYLGIEIF